MKPAKIQVLRGRPFKPPHFPRRHGTTEQPVQQDENQLIAERRAKLAEWRKTGKAFSQRLPARELAPLLDGYGDKTSGRTERMPVEVRVAGGRMMPKRVMGKASPSPRCDHLRPHPVTSPAKVFGEDVTAISGVVGTLMKTKTGELTIHAPRSAC